MKSNKKITKKILTASILFLSFLIPITSCQNVPVNQPEKDSSIKNSDVIKGTIQYPESFKVKTNFSTVATAATVSVINVPNHPTDPNKTVATGLTDSSGNFLINANFTFTVGDIFILEASNRIGGDIISLRTYIKKTSNGWEGMTTPGLYINTKTTALSIIADYQTSDITPSETIGTIDVSGGTSVPSDINAQVSAQNILDVATLVTNVLSKNGDPVRFIKREASNYIIGNPTPITAPQVYNIHPNMGLPGHTVIVGGKNFSTNIADNTVTIDGINATVTKALSDRLHVTVPSGITSSKITVTTPAGTSQSPETYYGVFDIPANTITNVSATSGKASNFPNISVDIFGTPSVMWEDESTANSQKDIFYSFWNTSSWKTPIIQSTFNYPSGFPTTKPSTAIDRKGRRFAVYNFGQNIYLTVSKDGGFTWSPFVDVGWNHDTQPDSDITNPTPQIAIGYNKIHIVWVAGSEIYYTQTAITNIIDSSNNFQNPTYTIWTNPVNLSATTLDSTEPTLVADSRDYVYLAWADKLNTSFNPSGNYRILYARYFRNDANTSNPHVFDGIIFSSDIGNARAPSIALNAVQYPHLTYHQNVSGLNQIIFSKSTNRENVGSWITPTNISANSVNNINSEIATDAKGFSYVVWEYNASSIYYTHTANLVSNSWQTPEKISQATGTAKNPDIIMDELRNAVHVTWESNADDSNYDVYHIQKTGVLPPSNRIAKITTNKGVIKMILFEDELPNTCANFVNLVNTNFYDGLTFHRYEPGFVIQGGDPNGNGTGGSGQTIPLEISSRYSYYREGMVGMARSSAPDTGSSQFFFTLAPATFLDGSYSLFATAISGGDVIQSLRVGDQIIDIEIINP